MKARQGQEGETNHCPLYEQNAQLAWIQLDSQGTMEIAQTCQFPFMTTAYRSPHIEINQSTKSDLTDYMAAVR